MRDSPEKLIEEWMMKSSITVKKRTSTSTLIQSTKDICNFLFYFRDHKTYVRKLHFSDDDKLLVKKEEKYTDFDEEIKLLRNTITKNSTEQETDSIYKKLEELLWNFHN